MDVETEQPASVVTWCLARLPHLCALVEHAAAGGQAEHARESLVDGLAELLEVARSGAIPDPH